MVPSIFHGMISSNLENGDSVQKKEAKAPTAQRWTKIYKVQLSRSEIFPEYSCLTVFKLGGLSMRNGVNSLQDSWWAHSLCIDAILDLGVRMPDH